LFTGDEFPQQEPPAKMIQREAQRRKIGLLVALGDLIPEGFY